MIYSISLPGHSIAYPGKSVWRTFEEAGDYRNKMKSPNGNDFHIWAIEADWERDTIEAEGHPSWHELTIDAEMLLVCEDCGFPYKDFPLDVLLPDDQWQCLTGRADGSGILCAGCIVQRAAKLPGVTVAKMVLE